MWGDVIGTTIKPAHTDTACVLHEQTVCKFVQTVLCSLRAAPDLRFVVNS